MDGLDMSALYGAVEIELKHCPNDGGELKTIAAIPEAPVIEKPLSHLRLTASTDSAASPRPGSCKRPDAARTHARPCQVGRVDGPPRNVNQAPKGLTK